MPRAYTRKTTRAASYTKEDLRLAIEKVRSGELTNYAASKMYGIPRSTLNDRVLRKTGLTSKTLGRPPAIPPEIELRLSKCLCTLEKWGWGLSRYEVLDIISKFIKTNKIQTPFKDDKPGPDWFIAFRKRNNLSIKKPQPVEYLRKRMTDPFVIHEYFSILKKTLRELNLDDPDRIWNLDETSVALDPTKTKVVGGKGKPCTRTTAGTGKENITVLTTVNAAGRKLNPLIVYKGKNVYQQWLAEEKEQYGFEIAYAASKRGWMETDIFFNYMKNIVIPSLGEKRPVLMIYDGHSTHVNPEVIALAVDNNITILKLPAHTSHLLQPLDLAVFKSFKSIWDRRLIEWQRQNIGTKLRKQAFAEIFAETWYLTSPKVIQNGFRKGGIYPFDDTVIPVEKYDPQAYKRWTVSQKKVSTLQNLCLEVLNKNLSITTNVHPEFKDSAGTMTFEELLLNKITQHNVSSNKNLTKLKRVAKGAEVITLKILEKNQKTDKEKNTQTNTQIPGPSTVNTTTKKKNKIIKNIDKTSTGKEETHLLSVITHTDSILEKNKRNKKKKTLNHSDKTLKSKEEQIYPEKTTNSDETCYKNKVIIETDHVNDQKPTSSKLKNTIKKQKNKTKKKINSMKAKRQSGGLFDSTTSESGDISAHSDSDIIDLSDLDLSEFDLSKSGAETKEYQNIDLDIDKELQEDNVFFEILNGKEDTQKKDYNMETANQIDDTSDIPSTSSTQVDNIPKNKVTILSSVRFKPENCPFLGLKAFQSLKLNKIEPNLDISKNRKRKSTNYKTKGKENVMSKKVKDISYEEKQRNEEYSIGDKVLVRYYTRIWKYYVGVIESICVKSNNYNIYYYKSAGKKELTKFTIPKRKDYDTVPENLIVKKIELLQLRENPDEFVLMNDEDGVYFE